MALPGLRTDAIPVDTTRPHHNRPHIYFEALLGGRSNAGQVSRDALVQADDTLRELVDRGDQRQSHGGHDQGVFDQVLSVLFLNKAIATVVS